MNGIAFADGSLDPRRWKTLSNLVLLASTSSSNDLAGELVDVYFEEDQELPATVLASDGQTSARGRKGGWSAPAGRGLYLTVVRRASPGEPLSLVPLALARWLREALAEAAGLDASLKWPNDVFVHGKKVAGILSESRTQGDDTYVSIGLGLNVRGDGASLGFERATTVEEATGRPQKLAALLQTILDRFDEELSAPGWEREVELWQRASVHHPGDRLTVRGAAGELSGEYRGLTAEGFLRLATPGGGETVLTSGELASW